MRIEPWVEEEERQIQWEEEREKWLETRPKCLICGEPIGEEECIDFSGSMEDGYVYHADCLSDALRFGKINLTRGEELYELISNNFLRRGE